MQVKALGVLPQTIIQAEVQLFGFIEGDPQTTPIRIFEFLEIEVFQFGADVADARKANRTDAADDRYPVFGLNDALVLVTEPAGIISPHNIGPTQSRQAAQGHFTGCEQAQHLQGEDLLLIDPDKAPEIECIASILVIRPHPGHEVIKPELHHAAFRRRESMVAGVEGEAKAEAGDMVAITPDDLLLIEQLAGVIMDIEDALMFKDHPQKKIVAYPTLRM